MSTTKEKQKKDTLRNSVLKVWDWFVTYCVPVRVYWFFRHLRHPGWWWADRANLKWAQSIQVGDTVCDCRGKHIKVVEKDDQLFITDSEGMEHDLLHCCEAIQLDDSCHTYWQQELTDCDECDYSQETD